MATKAELEAELKALRDSIKADNASPDPEQDTAPPTSFEEMLEAQGIAPDDIKSLWDQFSHEFGDLPHQKPLLTAVAAFGLGFVLGRMSRS